MASYQSQYTGTQVDAAIANMRNIIDIIYPVGAIYISTSSINPSTYMGGTWTPIRGKFLLSEDSTYTAGSTGGEATHTLTVNEMPSHKHAIGYRYNTNVASGSTGNWVVDPGTIQDYNNGTCIQNTGGGTAHNNMPPYLSVYMWERTT